MVYSSKLRSYTGKKAANNQYMHWKSATSWRCADLLDCVFPPPIKVVRTAGLEPATFGSGNHCSIQLSYARKRFLGYANETQSATLVFGLLRTLFFLVLRSKNSNTAKK